jgi:iron complex outermembrane receptor protein
MAKHQWSAPLDRTISLDERDASLRNVLSLLASAAKLRLSYAAELLPLDRRVCAAFDSVAVGDALTQVLAGTTVEPIAAGSNQVVLAPTRHAVVAAPVVQIERPTNVLERVVVTGALDKEPDSGSAISREVVSGGDLVRRGASNLAEALNGAVPGIWVWEQSPTSAITRYASTRGASSFGASAPKIYIDGVEVANPLLLTQMSAETVDRVEVIRGPQGAAIYGADAIGGVINISTRHDAPTSTGQRVELRSSAGYSGSQFAPLGVLAQEHSINIRSGSETRSGGLGVSYNKLGAYIPGAFSRQLMGTGDLRFVRARSTLTATARLFSQEAGSARSPLLGSWMPPIHVGFQSHGPAGDGDDRYERVGTVGTATNAAPQFDNQPESVRQYTLGANASFATNGPWTPSVVVGVDGYRLRNVTMTSGPLPSAADSALGAASGSADRLTFRTSTTGRFGEDEKRSATVVLAAEHTALREETAGSLSMGGGPALVQLPAMAAWRTSTGLSGQVDVAFRRTLFFTGGLRVERDAGYTLGSQYAALPMVGAAYVTSFGPATLKLRSAYGKAIRPARTTFGLMSHDNAASIMLGSRLAPEEQSGIEAGADLSFGRALTLRVTRFDQEASGLVQPVTVAEFEGRGPYHERRIAYQLQNVGEISNRGWEMQGTTGIGALSLAGTLSLVDSRVMRVAAGYSGDLRAGDRMLEVPARTATLTATWNASRWTTSWTLARASDFVNYDRLAVAQTLSTSSQPEKSLVGDALRSYWRTYGGVTRLRATVTRDLFRGLSLVGTGENLLGQQTGEPDNITIVPGRTITLGIRAKF